jgi:DNA polymerase-4
MRKIIHIDMDCFYAAVEARDNPALRNLPLAVGGRPDKRGVIATCNYIAREFGVHSALSSSIAKQRCPNLVIVPPNLNKYREVSRQIHAIFSRYTSQIEPLSLDEAYLDVTGSEAYHGSGTLIAQAIKNEIKKELKLTASAGVAPNKFLAKVASDWHKPDGLKTIAPEQINDFVFNLPVSAIPGVGKVMYRRLQNLNIRTCGDLQAIDKSSLLDMFGSIGERLYNFARGIDDREVVNTRIRKSVSVETTYDRDIENIAETAKPLCELFDKLSRRVNTNANAEFKNLFVKLKFSDFSTTTIERRAEVLVLDVFQQLLKEAWSRNQKPIRLLGIGVRLKEEDVDQKQLKLPFY